MKTAVIAASLALATTGSQAQSFTLDFGNGPTPPTICSSSGVGNGAMILCGNGGLINQAYGDVAGLVDVSYSNVRVPGNTLQWWANDYNDLYGVAYANNSYARIELKPLGGNTVTLTDFDMGAWPDTIRNTTIGIFEIGGGAALFRYPLLPTTSGPVGTGPTHTPFVLLPPISSNVGFWIEWRDDAFNVGIDNINFSIAVIPEPETYALLLAGLGLLGFAARRRRARA